MKLKGGYTGFTLSIRPSVDRIMFASFQATSEGVSRENFV